jgi:hypothetical protein
MRSAVKAEPGQGPRSQVLDEHVAAPDEGREVRRALLAPEVEHDAALGAV